LGAFLLVWIWPSDEKRTLPRVAKVNAMEKVKSSPKRDKATPKPKALSVSPVYLPPPPPEPEEIPEIIPEVIKVPEAIREPVQIAALKPAEKSPEPAAQEKPIAEVKPIKPQPKPERPKPKETKFTPLKPIVKKPIVKKKAPPVVVKAFREPIKALSKLTKVRSAKISRPKPKPQQRPTAPAIVNGTDPTMVRSGRVMLKLLEHGSGPKIEINWPAQSRNREALFRTFTRCYGMIVAVMDAKGGLFVADGAPRRPWKINLDRYSGFVRQSAGRDTGAQRQAVRKIRAHHRSVAGGPAIRVFPRTMDAVLLGGLKKLVGAGYTKSGAIKADYRLRGNQVIVERVLIDGNQIFGRIDLSGSLRPSCSI
jgi:hypothetical protein